MKTVGQLVLPGGEAGFPDELPYHVPAKLSW